MKLFKITLMIIATTFLFFSCDKDEVETIKSDAIVLYEGDPAVDGCGFFLLIDEKKYKPVVLDPEFSQDGLEVYIEYQLLDIQWVCNWQENKYGQIQIISIKKK